MENYSPAFTYVSPEIDAPTKYGVMKLTHYNTRIREFEPPNEAFDHVEHEMVCLDGLTRVVGFNVTPAQMKRFRDLKYPALHLPFVDEDTMEWATKVGMNHLWDEMGGEPDNIA